MVSIAPRPGKENLNSWNALPGEILQRLAQEGVQHPADWRALSRAKRKAIFGIVPSMVAAIDAAAGGEL